MKIFFSTILLILLSFLLKSQPALLWEERYEIEKIETAGSSFDVPLLRVDSENNVIVSSIKADAVGHDDIVILKYNSEGELLWDFIYGGEMLLDDFVEAFAIDSENNIIVTGGSYTKLEGDFDLFYAEFDQFILKISPNGDLIWKIKQPMLQENWHRDISIVGDKNNDIYLLENMHHLNGSLLKLNPDGEELWRYDFTNSYYSSRSLQIRDNKLITIGRLSYDSTRINYFDLKGRILSRHDLAQGFGGNIYLGEYNYYYSVYTNKYKISRLTSDGELLWSFEKPTNLPQGYKGDMIKDIVIDNELNIYITGQFYKDNAENAFYDSDILTFKLNPEGAVIWEHKMGIDGQSSERGVDLTETDYGIIVTGRSQINDRKKKEILFYIDKINGKTVWLIDTSKDHIFNYYNATTVVNNDELYTAELHFDEDNSIYTYIRKYDNPSIAITGINDFSQPLNTPVIYPNPATSEINLIIPETLSKYNLEVLDIAGKKVYESQELSDRKFSIPLNLKKGFYFFKIISHHFHFTKKIVIE